MSVTLRSTRIRCEHPGQMDRFGRELPCPEMDCPAGLACSAFGFQRPDTYEVDRYERRKAYEQTPSQRVLHYWALLKAGKQR